MFVRLLIVSVISVGLAACASTGSETTDSTETASVGNVTTENSTAQVQGEGVPELDASELPQTAEVEYDPNEVVCKREKQTGSRFTVKTCMTRAEMEAREERDQELMESMRRRQGGSQCAFSNDC